MKNLVSTSIITAFIASALLFSCKKNDTKPTPPVGIVGNWKLVTDTTEIFAANVPPAPHVYKGGPSDYYNFQSGGKLTWYQNNNGSDSATYSLNSQNMLTITYLPKSAQTDGENPTQTYSIIELTANKLVFVIVGLVEFKETMTFSR